jgi:hypothetical protein
MPPIEKRPNHGYFRLWFYMGLVVLIPVYFFSTVSNEWFQRPPKPIGDGLCYESIGFSIFSGNGFRENYSDPKWREAYQDSEYEIVLHNSGQRDIAGTSRPPLLPVIIATIYKVLGRGPDAYMIVRLFAAACLALAGAMASGLTAQLLANRSGRMWAIALGAFIAIGLAASSRTLKDYTSDFLTEPLALLLTESLIVMVVLRVDQRASAMRVSHGSSEAASECSSPTKWSWAVSAGVLLGLMILSRSLFVFWVPGLLLLLWAALPDPARYRARITGIVGATMLLTCLPWWAHNCWALGRFMPLGTQGVVALLGGYSQGAYNDGGNWSELPERELRAKLADSIEAKNAENDTARELLVVDAAKTQVIQWMQNNLSLLPGLAIKRAITHWNPYWGRAAIWKMLIVLGLVWTVLYGGASRWWLIGVPVLSTLVVMGLYETGGRFLVPLYGLLFTLGGLGVSGWWPAANPSECSTTNNSSVP